MIDGQEKITDHSTLISAVGLEQWESFPSHRQISVRVRDYLNIYFILEIKDTLEFLQLELWKVEIDLLPSEDVISAFKKLDKFIYSRSDYQVRFQISANMK